MKEQVVYLGTVEPTILNMTEYFFNVSVAQSFSYFNDLDSLSGGCFEEKPIIILYPEVLEMDCADFYVPEMIDESEY